MKVIDLLNKIANGEEVPKKMKTNYHTYELIKYPYCGVEITNYKDEEGDYLFGCEYELGFILNDEVEILDEEDEFIDIEEINNAYYHENQDRINQTFKNAINNLIKNQKKIIQALKENK